MGRKPTGKPNGRPKIPLSMLPTKEINFDQVIYWIKMQATAQEIASSFYTTEETLHKRLKEHFGMGFLELKKRYDGEGKLSLRRMQFNQAKKNASMAIWLGKQWLGQRDVVDVKEEVLGLLHEFLEELDNAKPETDHLDQGKQKKDQSVDRSS